jgi:hypothetical protein
MLCVHRNPCLPSYPRCSAEEREIRQQKCQLSLHVHDTFLIFLTTFRPQAIGSAKCRHAALLEISPGGPDLFPRLGPGGRPLGQPAEEECRSCANLRGASHRPMRTEA